MSESKQPPADENSKDEQIRTAAYYKWLEAGKPDGRHLDFWCAAEQEFAGARQETFERADDRAKSHREMVVRPKALPKPEKQAAAKT
jgi:hypothetical protein